LVGVGNVLAAPVLAQVGLAGVFLEVLALLALVLGFLCKRPFLRADLVHTALVEVGSVLAGDLRVLPGVLGAVRSHRRRGRVPRRRIRESYLGLILRVLILTALVFLVGFFGV